NAPRIARYAIAINLIVDCTPHTKTSAKTTIALHHSPFNRLQVSPKSSLFQIARKCVKLPRHRGQPRRDRRRHRAAGLSPQQDRAGVGHRNARNPSTNSQAPTPFPTPYRNASPRSSGSRKTAPRRAHHTGVSPTHRSRARPESRSHDRQELGEL